MDDTSKVVIGRVADQSPLVTFQSFAQEFPIVASGSATDSKIKQVYQNISNERTLGLAQLTQIQNQHEQSVKIPNPDAQCRAKASFRALLSPPRGDILV